MKSSRTILIVAFAIVLVVAFAACQRNVGSSAVTTATTRTTTAATTTRATTTSHTTTHTTTDGTTPHTSDGMTDGSTGTTARGLTPRSTTAHTTMRGIMPRATTAQTTVPAMPRATTSHTTARTPAYTTTHTSAYGTSGVRRAGSVAAMSTDIDIGALDSTRKDWGPGGPKDANGRSQGAISYQSKYGKYDAHFIAPESEKIYLTFDEGYENGYTAPILDTLKEKDVPAVFFVTYDYVKDNPELVQRMIDEGHIIGNHTYKHKYMSDIPIEESFNEIKILHDYMLDNFDYEMTLFRFPSGCFNEQTLALAQSMGYTSVFWSFAYLDYDVKNQMGADKAFEKVSTGAAHLGAIILLHAVSKDNADILGGVIDKLRGDGLVFSSYDVQY